MELAGLEPATSWVCQCLRFSRPEFGLDKSFQSVLIGSPNIFPNTLRRVLH